jgi:hypothetical protein
MPRSRASAKAAGSRFERVIADHLAAVIDDRIDRRVKTGAADKGDIGGLRVHGQRVVLELKDYGGQIKAGPVADGGRDRAGQRRGAGRRGGREAPRQGGPRGPARPDDRARLHRPDHRQSVVKLPLATVCRTRAASTSAARPCRPPTSATPSASCGSSTATRCTAGATWELGIVNKGLAKAGMRTGGVVRTATPSTPTNGLRASKEATRQIFAQPDPGRVRSCAGTQPRSGTSGKAVSTSGRRAPEDRQHLRLTHLGTPSSGRAGPYFGTGPKPLPPWPSKKG